MRGLRENHDGATISLRHLLGPEQNAKSTALAVTAAGMVCIEFSWLGKNDTIAAMAFEADEFILKRYFKNTLFEIPIEAGLWLFGRCLH